MLRLSLRPRLMLLFFMEDMAMEVSVMPVLAMLVLAMEDLAMLVLVIVVLATMARGLLKLSLRPRLTLLFFMEDMAMVDMDVDMPDLDILDLDMPDMEVTVLDMAVVSIMVKSYLPFFMKQKLKVISDWHVVIQCPLQEV